MSVIWICFLILFLIPLVLSESANYRLEQKLLKAYPKDGTRIVPTSNAEIKVRLNIYSIFGLSEKEVMEMNGWATIFWEDPKLKWNPTEWSNITMIQLPAKQIWTPDIGIANSKQIESKDFSHKEGLHVEVRHTGELIYFAYFISETPCPLRTKRLPFDVQKCPVLVGSYYSRSNQFKIIVNSIEIPGLTKTDSVGQWKIDSYESEDFLMGEGNTDDRMFQTVKVTFNLRRKPLYHIVLVIIPYCLICFVGSIMFVMKEPGERFGIALTILLAMSVYFMIVSQEAPKSMDELSLLDIFLLIQMFLVVILTIIVVVGPIFCNKKPKEEKEMKDKDVENDSQPEDEEAMEPGGQKERVRFRKKDRKFLRWRRAYDFIAFGIYMLGSCLSGVVCLVIIPRQTPTV